MNRSITFRTDEELIKAIKGPDEMRNQALYFAYFKLGWRDSAINLVAKYGGDIHDGDEISNDALVAVDRNIRNDKFNQESSLLTYYLAIVKKIWWKRTRRDPKFKSLEFELDQESSTSLEDDFFNKEKLSFLEKVIEQLSESCRELLKYTQLGYTNEEIKVEKKFKNANMAKKAVYRCREKLKSLLQSNSTWYDF